MSFRVYLKVTDKEGQILYNEQILGNNKCFSIEEIKSITKTPFTDIDDCFECEVDLDKFLKMFTTYMFNIVESFTVKDFKESFHNPKSMFWTIPSWSITGAFAIIFDALTKIKYKHKDVTCILKGS